MGVVGLYYGVGRETGSEYNLMNCFSTSVFRSRAII